MFLLVSESNKTAFHENFRTAFYEEDCQTQVDAKFAQMMRIESTKADVIVLKLHSERNTIHSAETILFDIQYHSLSSDDPQHRYAAIDIRLKGSHKSELGRMRIPFTLPNLDITKPIRVLSHSKYACGGLFSEFEVNPAVEVLNVVDVELKSVEEENLVCNYLEMTVVNQIEPEFSDTQLPLPYSASKTIDTAISAQSQHAEDSFNGVNQMGAPEPTQKSNGSTEPSSLVRNFVISAAVFLGIGIIVSLLIYCCITKRNREDQHHEVEFTMHSVSGQGHVAGAVLEFFP